MPPELKTLFERFILLGALLLPEDEDDCDQDDEQRMVIAEMEKIQAEIEKWIPSLKELHKEEKDNARDRCQ